MHCYPPSLLTLCASAVLGCLIRYILQYKALWQRRLGRHNTQTHIVILPQCLYHNLHLYHNFSGFKFKLVSWTSCFLVLQDLILQPTHHNTNSGLHSPAIFLQYLQWDNLVQFKQSSSAHLIILSVSEYILYGFLLTAWWLGPVSCSCWRERYRLNKILTSFLYGPHLNSTTVSHKVSDRFHVELGLLKTWDLLHTYSMTFKSGSYDGSCNAYTG